MLNDNLQQFVWNLKFRTFHKVKFGSNWPSSFRDLQDVKSLQTDRQTDDGHRAMTKAHITLCVRWGKKLMEWEVLYHTYSCFYWLIQESHVHTGWKLQLFTIIICNPWDIVEKQKLQFFTKSFLFIICNPQNSRKKYIS